MYCEKWKKGGRRKKERAEEPSLVECGETVRDRASGEMNCEK